MITDVTLHQAAKALVHAREDRMPDSGHRRRLYDEAEPEYVMYCARHAERQRRDTQERLRRAQPR